MQTRDMRASKCTPQLQKQLLEKVFEYFNKYTHQKALRAINFIFCLQFHFAKVCHILLYHSLWIRSDVSFRRQIVMACGRYTNIQCVKLSYIPILNREWSTFAVGMYILEPFVKILYFCSFFFFFLKIYCLIKST